jgi:hypothetical protein
MTARTIPQGLAPLLELLELEQPRVVTATQLAKWAEDTGITWPPDLLIRRLRERGWLLDLTTKGVWEFAPASRAGAFGSGDPLIELRATLARDPSAPYVVAAESAAYLLGLASRRPDPDVIGAPEGVRQPKALKALRIVRWRPASNLVMRDGLPTWGPSTLLAFMGTRPSGYHDWMNVGEWLRLATGQVVTSDLARELQHRPRSAWARTAYLLDAGGQAEAARTLLTMAPVGRGPYHLGDRKGGRYINPFEVIDNIGLKAGSSEVADYARSEFTLYDTDGAGPYPANVIEAKLAPDMPAFEPSHPRPSRGYWI